MRFQDQSNNLRKAYNLLALNTSTIQTSDGNRIRINNLNNLSEVMSLLKNFKHFEIELKNLRNYDVFDIMHGETITMNQISFNAFNSTVKQLRDKVFLSLSIIDSIMVSTDEKTLCIKLVEHVSLKDFAAELELLDSIIMQVITHKDINSSYKFSSFDIGSSWVNIIVGTTVAFNLLAGLVWSSCVIRKKWNEGSLLEETVKSMQIKNESLEDIRLANKKLLDELANKEAENLMSEYNLEDTDNEYKKRLIHSIIELAKLINDGVQIQPALMAPEESKNLFPNYEKLDFIESKTKLIENKE